MAILLQEQAALTSQNQITMPKRVRQVLHLRGGKSRVGFIIAKNGTVQVVRAPSKVKQAADDAVLEPFLTLLAKDIEKNPQRIKLMRPALLKKARSLIRNVKVDLNGPLGGRD